MHNIIFKDCRFSERPQNGNRQHGYGYRRGNREPGAQSDIHRNRSEQRAENRPQDYRAPGELLENARLFNIRTEIRGRRRRTPRFFGWLLGQKSPPESFRIASQCWQRDRFAVVRHYGLKCLRSERILRMARILDQSFDRGACCPEVFPGREQTNRIDAATSRARNAARKLRGARRSAAWEISRTFSPSRSRRYRSAWRP